MFRKGKITSPGGVILFLNMLFFLDRFGLQSFPSPLGFSLSEYMAVRPFYINAEFPSPLGAIYFQMNCNIINTNIFVSKFPSPLGVSYFRIRFSTVLKTNSTAVFRPLSELFFQNYPSAEEFANGFLSPAGVSVVNSK